MRSISVDISSSLVAADDASETPFVN
jgi:hypothetical protein